MTTLTAHQGDAVRAVTARLRGEYPEPLTYIGGFAGTGKSTILPFILEECGFDPQKIAFMAPTGKAAKIMRNKLKAQNFPNWFATTIHSAIYRAKPAPVAQLESELYAHQQQREEARATGDRAGVEHHTRLIQRLEADLENVYVEDKINFQLNVDSPVSMAEVIVVDEASMVGETMANDLLSFGVPVIAMGDPGQLPPVQDKPGLTRGRPDFFLTEIHRQAADNPIIQLATLAREGKDLPLGQYHDPAGVLRAEVINRSSFDPEPAIAAYHERIAAMAAGNGDLGLEVPQVLCGTNRTRWRITRMYREGLSSGPVKGEPLIVRKNSKEHPALVNGALVTSLSDVDLRPGQVSTRMSFQDDEGATYPDKAVFQGLFEEHYTTKKNVFSTDNRSAYRAKQRLIQLDFAACLTVHNYQGSQADHVILIDESSCFREDADKHLYTGITRAAETLKILI
jgi:exodeoxyribonuclease-5